MSKQAWVAHRGAAEGERKRHRRHCFQAGEATTKDEVKRLKRLLYKMRGVLDQCINNPITAYELRLARSVIWEADVQGDWDGTGRSHEFDQVEELG